MKTPTVECRRCRRLSDSSGPGGRDPRQRGVACRPEVAARACAGGPLSQDTAARSSWTFYYLNCQPELDQLVPSWTCGRALKLYPEMVASN